MRLQKKKTVEWRIASYSEAFSFLLIACSPTYLSKMFTVCPFHSQIYRTEREMSAQPQPNSMNPDIERELARRPAGAYDPAKALAAVEAVLAVVAFAVLCAVVLSTAPQRAVGPEAGAYRASCVAMPK